VNRARAGSFPTVIDTIPLPDTRQNLTVLNPCNVEQKFSRSHQAVGKNECE